MNETVLMWLFGGLCAWNAALSGATFSLYKEITKIRTILIITSKRAAEILHSPDDHLGIDQLLDRYITKEHELSYNDWQELKARCEEIIANPSCAKSERLLALFVVEFSQHKLMLRPNNFPPVVPKTP